MRSRLAASYSQARSSHLRAAVTSLRPSAASAGSIRCRSRGSTVRARASATKLVALSGRVDTSALAVRSANSRSVNAKLDCVLTIRRTEVLAFTGFGGKAKGGGLPRTQSTRRSLWTIHPKGVDCSPSSATVDWALTAERLGRSHQATRIARAPASNRLGEVGTWHWEAIRLTWKRRLERLLLMP
jgi:hypothetical protein